MVLNGKEMVRGFELAFTAMSIGEEAIIIISRDLAYKDDGVCQARGGQLATWGIVKLLGIE